MLSLKYNLELKVVCRNVFKMSVRPSVCQFGIEIFKMNKNNFSYYVLLLVCSVLFIPLNFSPEIFLRILLLFFTKFLIDTFFKLLSRVSAILCVYGKLHLVSLPSSSMSILLFFFYFPLYIFLFVLCTGCCCCLFVSRRQNIDEGRQRH